MSEQPIRDLTPTPPPPLSRQRKSEIKQAVLERVRSERAGDVWSRRRRRSLLGGALVAAVLASAGIAAALGLTGPDPQQAARVVGDHEQASTVHLDGWRPSLRAEQVSCLAPDADGRGGADRAETPASELPLADPLTRELLVEECASGNDMARDRGGLPREGASVCVYERGSYPHPAVALAGAGCADLGLGARPITDADLEEINRMRAVEVAVLAVPGDCPTAAEARVWAEERLAEAGRDLPVRVFDEGPGLCYRGVVYWYDGPWAPGVTVQVHGDQPADGDADRRHVRRDGSSG